MIYDFNVKINVYETIVMYIYYCKNNKLAAAANENYKAEKNVTFKNKSPI